MPGRHPNITIRNANNTGTFGQVMTLKRDEDTD
jgi:hypothetical protein